MTRIGFERLKLGFLVPIISFSYAVLQPDVASRAALVNIRKLGGGGWGREEGWGEEKARGRGWSKRWKGKRRQREEEKGKEEEEGSEKGEKGWQRRK